MPRIGLFVALALLALASPAFAPRVVAEEEASFEARVAILRIEMNRGPAEELLPFLDPASDPAPRRLAIRALGRIGADGAAPAILARLLETEEDELVAVLRAAGLVQSKDLAEGIAFHLAHGDPRVLAAAALALGATRAEGQAERLSKLLLHQSPEVRAAALRGLARLRTEAILERALSFLDDPSALVRDAARHAAWASAAARRATAEDLELEWGGDPALVMRLLPELAAERPERRIGALRVLSALLPETLEGDALERLLSVAEDADPRVVSDLVTRILRRRENPEIEAVLARLLGHEDPLVRVGVLEELARRESESSLAALEAWWPKETDDRVRARLRVALVERGRHEFSARTEGLLLLETLEDAALRDEIDVRILLALPKEQWHAVTTFILENPAVHPQAKARLLSGVAEAGLELLEPVLRDLLAHGDPYLRSSALDALNGTHLVAHAEELDRLEAESSEFAARDVRRAVVDAWARIAKTPDPGTEDGRALQERARRRILAAALEDESAEVRHAAFAAGRELSIDGLPEKDPRRPNDWRGLPRPAGPILGLSFEGEGAWLDEAEILRLADRIREVRPTLVLETTAGSVALQVDAEEAPVHAASLVLGVAAGLYDGTRWHRVVPSFVIQGGDPTGTGAGDGGWIVPDEITERRFLRGALGMPKTAVRDTGGCQLFVMHVAYPPLDDRYTCYGHVVAGLGVVDRIRVGDRIRKARIVLDEGDR